MKIFFSILRIEFRIAHKHCIVIGTVLDNDVVAGFSSVMRVETCSWKYSDTSLLFILQKTKGVILFTALTIVSLMTPDQFVFTLK